MIFLDTSFLHALISKRDEHHQRVLDVVSGHSGKPLPDTLLTTNHVIAETLTLSRKLGHDVAVQLGRTLYAGELARVHWATPEQEREAFGYFVRYDDKHYSFVDCLSFVVMEQFGIVTAWSVDDDFTHRFTAVPGPLRKR